MQLNVHSYNSLCYGTMPIADLVTKAAAMGYTVLPLTDINTTMGVADFVVECRRKGVRPVVGVEVRNGNEAQRSIDANSKADYREGLNKELEAMRNLEMWQAGATVRTLRHENN